MNKKEKDVLKKVIPEGKYQCSYNLKKIYEDEIISEEDMAELDFSYIKDGSVLLIQSSTFSGNLGIALDYHDKADILSNIGEEISFGLEVVSTDGEQRPYLMASLGSFDMYIEIWDIKTERPI